LNKNPPTMKMNAKFLFNIILLQFNFYFELFFNQL